MKTFLARTVGQWRDWLAEHHAVESEVWLIFHKLHTGVASIDYKDALDEALCFGWVDSLVKRLDDRCFARKFTPRRADSRWSATNRKRYAALKASGRLTPAGIARAPTDRSYGPRPPRLEMPAKLPPYIQTALRTHPAALRHFEALAPSHRRRYLGWIESAKHEETKARRLKEAIRLLTAGKVLGLK
ncbi:MAG: YdeI/OmpD-associated family protein [Vicinamibacterales bacterium]